MNYYNFIAKIYDLFLRKFTLRRKCIARSMTEINTISRQIEA